MKYVVYGKPGCGYCTRAIELLKLKGLQYEYVDVAEDDKARSKLVSMGCRSVPQVFQVVEGVDPIHIGGYDELSSSLKE